MGGKNSDSCPQGEEQLQESKETSAEVSAIDEEEAELIKTDEMSETETDIKEKMKAGSEDSNVDSLATAEAGSEDETITIETLTQEISALEQMVEENINKALRAQAEIDNLHKRTRRDIENAHKYALEKFVMELLPVLDSMELGLSASDNAEATESLREGMELTLKMFRDTLEKFGIKVIDPQGEKFNPEQHEAVSMQELDDAESGSVISVMQKGYELNGRLVRPAMVMVAK